MKYLVTILFFVLCGVGYGQTITGSKTRTPGVWLSSKDTATNRTAADSIQVIANRADSSLRFYWSVGAPSRKIAFGDLGLKLNISDTAAMLTNYVQKQFALTNRRVPFVNNLGQLKDTTGFSWGGGQFNIPGIISGNSLNLSQNISISGVGQLIGVSSDVPNTGSVSNSSLLMNSGYSAIRFGTAGDFNIDVLNGGSYLNAFKINQSGTVNATLSTAAQPNITSLGTLTSLAVTGAITNTDVISSLRSLGAANFVANMTESAANDSLVAILGRGGSGTYNLADITIRQETTNASTGSLSINTRDAGGKQRGMMFDKSQTATLYRALTTTDNLTVSRNQNATTEILASNTDNTNSTSRGRVRIVGGTVESIVTSIATAGTYIGSSSNHPLQLVTNGSDRVTISTSGNVRFNNYGAGTLTTDASGNITASSDTTMKHLIAPLDTVLGKIMDFKPYYFKWRASTGLDTANQYLSITAQSIGKSFPLALGKSADGTLTVQDRAVLAIAVKAIQELKAENDNKQLQIDNLRYQIEEIKAILLKNNIK